MITCADDRYPGMFWVSVNGTPHNAFCFGQVMARMGWAANDG